MCFLGIWMTWQSPTAKPCSPHLHPKAHPFLPTSSINPASLVCLSSSLIVDKRSTSSMNLKQPAEYGISKRLSSSSATLVKSPDKSKSPAPHSHPFYIFSSFSSLSLPSWPSSNPCPFPTFLGHILTIVCYRLSITYMGLVSVGKYYWDLSGNCRSSAEKTFSLPTPSVISERCAPHIWDCFQQSGKIFFVSLSLVPVNDNMKPKFCFIRSLCTYMNYWIKSFESKGSN